MNGHPISRRVDARVIKETQRAAQLEAQGHLEKATEIMESLLLDFPDEPSVHGYLSRYLCRLHRFDEGIKYGRRAVELSPKSSLASLCLFHALWDAGQQSDAIAEIRRFLPLRRSEEKTAHYLDILTAWDAEYK